MTATAPPDTVDTRPAHDGQAPVERARSGRLVDGASLAAFRIGFGLLVAGSLVRFTAKGWIDRLYLQPEHHLTYARFEWVRPLPGPWMYVVIAVLAVSGAAIAIGWHTRTWAAVFTVGFAYTELIDASLYLNHYWYVTLVGLLLAIVPTDGCWSVDARRGRAAGGPFVPMSSVWAFRAQIAVVYLFAGLAKWNVDWVLHAQPMRLWLADRVDRPWVGPLLGREWVAHAASWFGLLFDTTIVAWLLWRRSRPWAYVAVIGFHLATWWLFRIGVFPWVMIVSTTVFFDPSWPRRFAARREPVASCRPAWTMGPLTRATLIGLAVVQVVLPLRHLLYPGDVRLTEEGYYLSWRVMLTEKSGVLDFVVRDRVTGEVWVVEPDLVLTDWQATQAAVRPDLLLATAHLIDEHERARVGHEVEVRAESFVSVNGGRARRLIDPTIDLSQVSRTAPLHRIVPIDG